MVLGWFDESQLILNAATYSDKCRKYIMYINRQGTLVFNHLVVLLCWLCILKALRCNTQLRRLTTSTVVIHCVAFPSSHLASFVLVSSPVLCSIPSTSAKCYSMLALQTESRLLVVVGNTGSLFVFVSIATEIGVRLRGQCQGCGSSLHCAL